MYVACAMSRGITNESDRVNAQQPRSRRSAFAGSGVTFASRNGECGVGRGGVGEEMGYGGDRDRLRIGIFRWIELRI